MKVIIEVVVQVRPGIRSSTEAIDYALGELKNIEQLDIKSINVTED